MSRTTISVPLTCSREIAETKITNTLKLRGYKLIDYRGEAVWKKGTGMMTAMQYIKYGFDGNAANLSGWIQAGVGRLGGPEMALSGTVAIIPKKAVLKVLEELQLSL